MKMRMDSFGRVVAISSLAIILGGASQCGEPLGPPAGNNFNQSTWSEGGFGYEVTRMHVTVADRTQGLAPKDPATPLHLCRKSNQPNLIPNHYWVDITGDLDIYFPDGDGGDTLGGTEEFRAQRPESALKNKDAAGFNHPLVGLTCGDNPGTPGTIEAQNYEVKVYERLADGSLNPMPNGTINPVADGSINPTPFSIHCQIELPEILSGRDYTDKIFVVVIQALGTKNIRHHPDNVLNNGAPVPDTFVYDKSEANTSNGYYLQGTYVEEIDCSQDI